MDYYYKYFKYKSKYLNLIEQFGGAEWVDPTNGNRIHGAGIILIENYRGLPSIIMYRSILPGPRHGKYELPGGGIDMRSDPWTTATKELREESRGLFNIDPNFIRNPAIQYVDVPFQYRGQTYYNRQYIIYITGHDGHIRGDNYIHNIPVINANVARLRPNHPKQYQETDDIGRINIIQLNARIPGVPVPGVPVPPVFDIKINGISKRTGITVFNISSQQVNIIRYCLPIINAIAGAGNIIRLNYNPNDIRNPNSPFYGVHTYWI